MLRLFSTSGGSLLTEHFLPPDLAFAPVPAGATHAYHLARARAERALLSQRARVGSTRSLSATSGGGGGTIWSLAASPLQRFLAIGCEAGVVKLVDVGESARFDWLDSSSDFWARTIAVRTPAGERKERVGVVGSMELTKGRVMTLSWGPPRRLGGGGSAARKQQGNKRAAKGKAAEEEEDSEEESDSSSSSDSDDDDSSDEPIWDESFLVGGTASGVSVVWDVSTGRVLSRLSVFKSRSEQTILWSSAVLADGTIVLGDSSGGVTFYDARTRLPIVGAAFKVHGDAADVLALCVGPDGRKVYSASVDQRVVEYTLVPSHASGAGAGAGAGKKGTTQQTAGTKWVHTATRRLHAHDIRALAIEPRFDIARHSRARIEASSGQLAPPPTRVPILVSGGTDFHVVMTPAATTDGLSSRHLNPVSNTPFLTFGETTQRKVAYVPATSRASLLGGGGAAQLCARQRWIVLRRSDSVAIWELPSTAGAVAAGGHPGAATGLVNGDSDALGLPPLPMDGSSEAEQQQQQWNKVIEMQFKTKTPLVSVAVSPDGQLLAVSDLYESKLFQLVRRRGTGALEPRRIASFGTAFANTKRDAGASRATAPGASGLVFTPDSRRLVLSSYASAMVYVVDIETTGACTIAASFDLHRRKASPVSHGRQLAGKLSGRPSVNGHADESMQDDQDDDESTPSIDAASSKEQVYAVVHHLKVSPDGQWLLTMDSLRRTHVFSLDLLAHHRSLPPRNICPRQSSSTRPTRP